MLQILIIRLTALSNHCVPGTSLLDSTDPRNMFSHWFFTSHLSACRLDITKIPKRRVPRINESLHQAPVSIYAGMCLLRFSSVPVRSAHVHWFASLWAKVIFSSVLYSLTLPPVSLSAS